MARQLDVDGVIRQASIAKPFCQLVAQSSAHSPVSVLDLHLHIDRLGIMASMVRQCCLAQRDEVHVQACLQAMVLLHHVALGSVRAQLGSGQQQLGQVDAAGLGVGLNGLPVHLQHISAAHHLIQGPEAQAGHDLTQLLGHHEEVVDHVLRLTSKLGAQLRVLGGDAHGALVGVALAHHDAANSDEGAGGEAKLLSTQQGSNSHIAASTQLAVHLHGGPATQVVGHQGLVGLCQAQLPRQTRMLDGGPLGSASATVMARDEHVVGMALDHT
mmetsp:Transcript_30094/g.66685  ORF Transcript_30094/g.66685 Transcript_30094/m.66685 type:complete len:271 (+) Transcript_30094:3246-4058(+)